MKQKHIHNPDPKYAIVKGMRTTVTDRTWTLAFGATVLKEGVRFRVWAPKATSLSLIVIGKSKELPMKPDGEGWFEIMVEGLGSGTKYFYLLNGAHQRPDPASRFQPEGVHRPSQTVDPGEFHWEDQGWNGMPLEQMIIYEIHTGTFTREGTFEAILPLLDYLKEELGVTALELMPVSQFPGERNWGYDGTYLYAPQNSYGGPTGLKTLINACHKKGLSVILDVVYNHLGPEGNYLGDFGPYFTDRYRTPWGAAMNFDGPESDDVRKFVIDNALYWVTEYHVDGLRIDAIHGIFDFSARHILYDIREAVHRQAKIPGRPIVVIAESDLNDPRAIDSPRRGGYGLDAQWNDDLHHCLHTLLTKERHGYYQDFGELNQLAKALQEGFVYSGQYSRFRKRRHGSSSKHLPPSKFIVFSQNHDQVGNRPRGERLSALVSLEALKLAAGMVLLSPPIPLLFMGEEYGSDTPFLYFVSHSDQGLIEAVRRGRKEQFSLAQWEGEIPDPQDEGTFLKSKIDLNLRHHPVHKVLLDFYRRLIKLRKEIPALGHPEQGRREVKAFQTERILLIRRSYEKDRIFYLFSFNEKPAKIDLLIEDGRWEKILDSSSHDWGGESSSAPDSIQSAGSKVSFVLSPLSFALYRKLNHEG